MRFNHPIEGKNAQDLFDLNINGTGGFFPIGKNSAWHGGIHFDGEHTLLAIADGEVVAYRFSKEYLEYTKEDKTYRYSNCFVLVRHTISTPNGATLSFFSHYGNCAPFDSESKPHPDFLKQKCYEITATAINVRSSMESSTADNIIKIDGKDKQLSKGENVFATAVDDRWAKIDGKEEYFVFANFTKEVYVSIEPELDKVVTCSVPVKAGDIIGYTGIFERKNQPENQRHVHFEIFSADNVPAFIANPKEDGKNRPTALKISSGAVLKKQEKKFSENDLQMQLAVTKGSRLLILDHRDSEYLFVREHEIIRAVPHRFLSWQSTENHYLINWDHAGEVSKIFDSYEFERTDTFLFLERADVNGNPVQQRDAPNRIVKFVCDEEYAERFWVKRSDFEEVDDKTAVAQTDLSSVYRHNPNTMKYEIDAGSVTDDSFIKIEACETAKDETGVLWYKVKADGVEGWISQTDPLLEKQSVFDWKGFRVVKEDGDCAYDMLINYRRTPPFFKKIFEEIDVSGDKKICKEEMLEALRDSTISERLSKLICFHPSEWWVDSEFSYWNSVFLHSSEEQKNVLKEQLRNLCWWGDVAKGIDDFPAEPNVYHFHPVAFVENMKKMNTGLHFPLKRIPYNHPDNFKNPFYQEFDYTDYSKRAAPFGAQRGSNRLHAASDLYTDVGEPVYSVDDGKVISVSFFYMDTWQITIEHEHELTSGCKMVIRYGEVSKLQTDILVKSGDLVKKGQQIAKVGKLINNNGTEFQQPDGEVRGMLHLEMYTGEDTGPLSLNSSQSPYVQMRYAKSNSFSTGRSFLRRKDLYDPLPELVKMYNSSSLTK